MIWPFQGHFLIAKPIMKTDQDDRIF